MLCGLIAALAALASPAVGTGSDEEQAMALAQRLSKSLTSRVAFHKIEADGGKDVFTLESRGGKVIIGGNNAGSMAVGLN